MIEIRAVDGAHREDVNLPNEPFALTGRLIPAYSGGAWTYRTERFDAGEMRFPDENYDCGALAKDGAVLGAYDGETCVGLAILRNAPFRYLYVSDLKVNADRRGSGIGRMLIGKAKELAAARGYRGLSLIAQDNNLGACLFYLRCGFRIGGLDTEVYRGTSQEGKADITFYLDC